MIRLFRHIRRQPKHIRDNYAVGIAASFTAIVVVFWGMSRMGDGFSDSALPKGESQTPFATLIKESKEHLANIKNSFASSTDNADQTAGVAGSVEAPVVDTSDLVLTQEDIEIANQGTTTASTTSTQNEKPVYREVIIETTTSTSTELDNPSNSGSAETSS